MPRRKKRIDQFTDKDLEAELGALNIPGVPTDLRIKNLGLPLEDNPFSYDNLHPDPPKQEKFWKPHEKHAFIKKFPKKMRTDVDKALKREKNLKMKRAIFCEQMSLITLGPERTIDWWNWIETGRTIHPAFPPMTEDLITKLVTERLFVFQKAFRKGTVLTNAWAKFPTWAKFNTPFLMGVYRAYLFEAYKDKVPTHEKAVEIICRLLYAGLEGLAKKDVALATDIVEHMRKDELSKISPGLLTQSKTGNVTHNVKFYVQAQLRMIDRFIFRVMKEYVRSHTKALKRLLANEVVFRTRLITATTNSLDVSARTFKAAAQHMADSTPESMIKELLHEAALDEDCGHRGKDRLKHVHTLDKRELKEYIKEATGWIVNNDADRRWQRRKSYLDRHWVRKVIAESRLEKEMIDKAYQVLKNGAASKELMAKIAKVTAEVESLRAKKPNRALSGKGACERVKLRGKEGKAKQTPRKRGRVKKEPKK